MERASEWIGCDTSENAWTTKTKHQSTFNEINSFHVQNRAAAVGMQVKWNFFPSFEMNKKCTLFSLFTFLICPPIIDYNHQRFPQNSERCNHFVVNFCLNLRTAEMILTWTKRFEKLQTRCNASKKLSVCKVCLIWKFGLITLSVDILWFEVCIFLCAMQPL